jgi:hypothetical protein
MGTGSPAIAETPSFPGNRGGLRLSKPRMVKKLKPLEGRAVIPAATKPEAEYGNDGGKNRDHARDGRAVAQNSPAFLGASEFDQAQPRGRLHRLGMECYRAARAHDPVERSDQERKYSRVLTQEIGGDCVSGRWPQNPTGALKTSWKASSLVETNIVEQSVGKLLGGSGLTDKFAILRASPTILAVNRPTV